jgi:hypothetical protein
MLSLIVTRCRMQTLVMSTPSDLVLYTNAPARGRPRATYKGTGPTAHCAICANPSQFRSDEGTWIRGGRIRREELFVCWSLDLRESFYHCGADGPAAILVHRKGWCCVRTNAVE